MINETVNLGLPDYSGDLKFKSPLVSCFKSVTDKTSVNLPILKVLNQIKEETLKLKMEKLRFTLVKSEKELLKKQLPCITVSGIFKNGHAAKDLIKHSGLMQIDFDSVLNFKDLKEKICRDIYTYACFISPSGTGIKAIVKILPELHLESFEALTTYYAVKYDTLMDAKCKDVGRLMYLSYDENLYINENAMVFDVIQNKVEQAISQIENTQTDITSDYGNWLKIGFAFAGQFGEAGREYFHRVSKVNVKYDSNTCNKQYDNCLKSSGEGVTIKTFFHLSKEAGLTGSTNLKNKEGVNQNLKQSINPSLSTVNPRKPESLLKIRSVNECINEAKTQPIPKMLFAEFWHEGELCILFADTNLGKSILAVQIANSISRGEAIRGFKMETPKQMVLFADFEMSEKQFEKRYSLDYTQHYLFDENFKRITINPDCLDFEDFEKQLFEQIEKGIIEYGAKILIVDNITYLKTQATETAKEALPLMKKLNELKKKYSLSILALAHTPKRNMANPITKNDLAGSKHLANFTDSVFAIGESFKDKSLRYLKQLKARATEIKYDSDNIILCEITKPTNFLGFEFSDFSNEREHLKYQSEGDLKELDKAILAAKQDNPSISNYAIAQNLGTNQMKVKRVLERNEYSNTY